MPAYPRDRNAGPPGLFSAGSAFVLAAVIGDAKPERCLGRQRLSKSPHGRYPEFPGTVPETRRTTRQISGR
jgi:hypothetical protein